MITKENQVTLTPEGRTLTLLLKHSCYIWKPTGGKEAVLNRIVLHDSWCCSVLFQEEVAQAKRMRLDLRRRSKEFWRGAFCQEIFVTKEALINSTLPGVDLGGGGRVRSPNPSTEMKPFLLYSF